MTTVTSTESPTHCRFCGASIAPRAAGELASAVLCSQCGLSASAGEVSTPLGPWSVIDRYFRDLWTILTRPSIFFRQMPHGGAIAGPLAFALITNWLGSALEFLWQSATGGLAARYLEDLFQIAGEVAEVDHPGRSALLANARDRLIHWLWGTGSVLLDPFLTAASVLFTSALVFVGAKLLVTPGKNGAPARIDYSTALKIICFSMSPAILAGIPLIGAFLARLCVVIVTIIGVREVYRVGNARATVIALFPKLLFLAILVSGFLLLAFMLFKGMTMLF